MTKRQTTPRCVIYTCCSLNIFPFSNRSQFSAFPIFQARVSPSNAFQDWGEASCCLGNVRKDAFRWFMRTPIKKVWKQGRKGVPGKEWLSKVINFVMMDLMGWKSVAERHAIRKSLRKLNLNVDSVVTPATANILCAVEAFSCHKSFFMNFQLYLFFILFYDVQILWMETQTFNNFVNENLFIGATVNNERVGWNEQSSWSEQSSQKK